MHLPHTLRGSAFPYSTCIGLHLIATAPSFILFRPFRTPTEMRAFGSKCFETKRNERHFQVERMYLYDSSNVCRCVSNGHALDGIFEAARQNREEKKKEKKTVKMSTYKAVPFGTIYVRINAMNKWRLNRKRVFKMIYFHLL